MRLRIGAATALLTLLAIAGAAQAAPSPKSTAEITFQLATTGGVHPSCTLTITSSKDISNYTVNGVKTEDVNTTSVTISVQNGDVITVKSGTTTASYTVTGCAAADDPHDPDPHDPDPHDPDPHH